MTIRSGRVRELVRRERAGVGALDHGHALVLAQAVVELAVGDVERDHVGRAALEQAVGEAAGRGADVERAAAGDVDPSASSALASLTPPRETYGGGPSTSSSTAASTSWPGFSARRRPGPRWTWPAITAAAARVRDSNRPRSASRESRRTRGTGMNGTQALARQWPMRALMRPVLASFLVLLALPAAASAQTPPRRRSSYAAPDRVGLARRAVDLRRPHHRARRERRRARVRHDEVDDERPADRPGGHLAGRDRQAGDGRPRGLERARDSVLRQRPGHYYWQAYLTGDAATAPRSRSAPCRSSTVTLPAADKGRGSLFPRYGRRGRDELLPVLDGFPVTVDRPRFQKVVKTAAGALGPEGPALDEREGGRPGRLQRRRLLLEGAERRARRADRLHQARQGRRARPGAARGRELGRRARTIPRSTRSTSRASCCTSSATWRATRSTGAVHELADDRGAGRRRVVARRARQVVRRLHGGARASSPGARRSCTASSASISASMSDRPTWCAVYAGGPARGRARVKL